MKTRTKKQAQAEIFDSAADANVKAEAESSPAASNGHKKDRFQLSFDLDENGMPDFSSMRGKTKERVREFFADPKMAEAFGVSPQAGTARSDVPLFSAAMIGAMYDGLGAVEAILAQRIGNVPAPIAKQVFAYSKEEKEQLAQPTARVLNKYATEWMVKYQDELALAGLLVMMTFAKVQACMMLSRVKTVNVPEAPETPQDDPEAKAN